MRSENRLSPKSLKLTPLVRQPLRFPAVQIMGLDFFAYQPHSHLRAWHTASDPENQDAATGLLKKSNEDTTAISRSASKSHLRTPRIRSAATNRSEIFPPPEISPALRDPERRIPRAFCLLAC